MCTAEHAPVDRSGEGCLLRFKRGLLASKGCAASGGLGIADARGCNRGDVGEIDGTGAAPPDGSRLLAGDGCAARQLASYMMLLGTNYTVKAHASTWRRYALSEPAGV